MHGGCLGADDRRAGRGDADGGPGLTNGLAPLYSALQAESPVLLISGDSSVAEDGKGAFQELDQVAITAR